MSREVDLTHSSNKMNTEEYQNVLEEMEEKFRATFDLSPIGMSHISLDGYFLRVNQKFADILGHTKEYVLENNFRKFLSRKNISKEEDYFREMILGKMDIYEQEKEYTRPDGIKIWTHITTTLYRNALNSPVFFVCIIEDITRQKKYESVLKEREELYKAIFDNNSAIKLLIDPTDNKIVDANQAACNFYKYTKEELLDRKITDINVLSNEEVELELQKAVELDKDYFQFPHRLSTGEIRTVEVYTGPVKFSDKIYILSIIHDVTEKKEAEDKLAFLSDHDTLTGLPNRNYILNKISKLIDEYKVDQKKFAVLFLDLDHFKNVNDSLGHKIGDELLKTVSKEILSVIKSRDGAARVGVDEFVFLEEEINHPYQVLYPTNRIFQLFQKPIVINESEVYLTGSLGISVFPEDGDNAEILIKNAETAMYQAKMNGRNAYSFYTPQLTEVFQEKIKIENSLRKALQNNEFELLYQPQVDMPTGHLVGAEALLRWNSPLLGSVSPTKFIPVAEDTGLIIPIGEWVLRMACQQWQTWKSKGLTVPKISINLSVVQIEKGNIAGLVRKILNEIGIDSFRVELEVTESVIMKKTDYVIKTLEALELLGVSLSIDDFGTGYSSLSYLKNLPVQKLKIDQTFVKNVTDDINDAAIVQAIIAIAKAMGLSIIAEGVETEAQAKILLEEGCDEAQGFLFSRPVTADDFFKRWK